MNANTFMHSVLWCCSSCGFTLEGGQPHMECPICESYKDSFINSPAHIEEAIRKEFKDLPNSAEARRKRLSILAEEGLTRRFRLKGRVTEACHGANASRGKG